MWRGCWRRSATIEHHERPEYLDRLAVLRNQVFVLDHMYMSLFYDLRLGVAAGRDAGAAGVDPPGAGAPGRVCAADGAHVDLAAGRGARGRRAGRGGQSAGAAPLRPRHDRAARQGGAGDSASVLAWSPSAGQAWERWYRPVAAARMQSALWHALGWAIFGAGVCRRPWCSCRRCSRPTPGDVLLVLAAGSRLSAYIGATVGEIGFLRGIWLDGSIRLAWLEDYAASLVHDADAPVPETTGERHPLRARVVRLSRHRPPRAR